MTTKDGTHTMHERRTYQRTRGACDVMLDAETNPPRMIKGWLMDISQTGLALQALQTLAMDTHATVRIETQDGGFCNEVIGRAFVVGVDAGEGPGKQHLIRMQFSNANAERVQALQTQMQLDLEQS